MPIDWDIVDGADAHAVPELDDGRLDPLRVRVVSLERRAADRRRMWGAGRAMACAYAAAVMAAYARDALGDHQRGRAVFYALVAAGLFCVAMRTARTRRGRQSTR